MEREVLNLLMISTFESLLNALLVFMNRKSETLWNITCNPFKKFRIMLLRIILPKDLKFHRVNLVLE